MNAYKSVAISLGLGIAALASLGGVASTAEACHICTNTGTISAECRYVRAPNGYSHCTVRTSHGSATCENGDHC